MRDEMMAAVIRRALEHPEFLDELIAAPEKALDAHGFALGDAELEEIRKLGTGGSAEERLHAIAAQFGVEPERIG